MKYIEYLQKQFGIEKIKDEDIQKVLDKDYEIQASKGNIKHLVLEYIIRNLIYLNPYERHNATIDLENNTLIIDLKGYSEYPLYQIDLKENNISKKELFYILFIFFAEFSIKISKIQIKTFLKQE